MLRTRPPSRDTSPSASRAGDKEGPSREHKKPLDPVGIAIARLRQQWGMQKRSLPGDDRPQMTSSTCLKSASKPCKEQKPRRHLCGSTCAFRSSAHVRLRLAGYREKVASAGTSGCDILLGLRGGVFRRLCWVLVVALLVGLTLREWIRVFGEYDQYRVFTSVHYDTKASLPFPDVTVCNVNPLRRSALCKDRWLARREALPDKVWRRECEEPVTYYEPNLEDAALQSELWLWMARKRRLNRSTVRAMGHQLRHMLVGCRLGNSDCMQARLFRRRLDSRYGNCFCLNCHGQEQHNASIFNYHTVSAPNAGMTLTLDVQPQEYLPTSTAMGFLVMVHGRGFRADACGDSVFAQPGYITYIGLRQGRRTALPEPYQPPCRDTWPSRLKHYLQNTTRYTREDCMKICHQEMIRYKCKCESQNLPFSSRDDRLKTPVCGEKHWDCVRQVRAVMDLPYVQRYCRCFRSCIDIDHYKELSFAAMPEEFHSNQTTVRKRLSLKN
ncbi:acid-sensing ion channel 3-like isoform X2 [Dermacentor andersoni]|uniref:acid-sensing ion channel 3-like isoform X2 n=1 Tax=Dermacentor andersoni TaxID=34620 RepID=UPI002417FEB8|nr:acid-sensing ion channel 4-A-like isoform X2 [Dermacentor andersoni]